MKKSTLILSIIFTLYVFSCSNDDSPEIKFPESIFNELSGDNGKAYRVVSAENTSNSNETPLDYTSCHLDDIYRFNAPNSFVITTGDQACFLQNPPIQLASTRYEYLPLSGDIQIHTQRHEQTGDEVYLLSYSLYLDKIESSGQLIFVGRDQHVGRRLVLEEIE